MNSAAADVAAASYRPSVMTAAHVGIPQDAASMEISKLLRYLKGGFIH